MHAIRQHEFGPPETLLYAKSLLPAEAQWAAMGTGRMEFPIVAQADIARHATGRQTAEVLKEVSK